jgi:phosphatidate cytidylyltransferase
MLLADRANGPWYPFLFLFFAVVGVGATVEMHRLLPAQTRPPLWALLVSVLALLTGNWLSHVGYAALGSPLEIMLGFFAAGVIGFFLLEIALYRAPGASVNRIALGVWFLAYLGVLPAFLTQLRWPRETDDPSFDRGAMALALAIFIPKFCDIGAYFTGKFLGRHPMTPLLSPKKTREGFLGGLAVAALATVIVNLIVPMFRGTAAAIGFGLTVGLAGIFGDLAESLIKRDSHQKDASSAVPGFGGVLDVIDSIIFAAPVAYWWLR